MIKSITFPKEGKGYIYEKIKKPIEPDKPEGRFSGRDYCHCKNDEERESLYKEMMAEYNKNLDYYNSHKGDYVLKCSNLLVGKTFNFEPHKVNVIFGPNGCGKTTIIKAIAGNAFITDGWTKLLGAADFINVGFGDATYEDEFPKKLEKQKLNSCDIDWDGVPIYFENFAYTEMNSRGTFGDLIDAGSIMGDLDEEVAYLMSRNKMNMGSKSAMIINKVLSICEKPKTYDDILAPYKKQLGHINDLWENCYKIQIDYFNSFPKANSGEPNTILFDEIDKSLDIENVLYLYTDLLPRFAEKYGVQFILVSHSPIILSDKVFNDKRYNIISMDKEYTERCRNLLK